jgi:hypothetical protein
MQTLFDNYFSLHGLPLRIQYHNIFTEFSKLLPRAMHGFFTSVKNTYKLCNNEVKIFYYLYRVHYGKNKWNLFILVMEKTNDYPSLRFQLHPIIYKCLKQNINNC